MSVFGQGSRLPREVARLYAACSLFDRLHVSARWRLCPFDAIASFAPSSGPVLDLGCGRGVLANLLALRSAARRVTALDPDPSKIEVARRTIDGRENIEFRVAETPPADERYRAVFLVDVLYLLPPARRRSLLAACRLATAEEGSLLVKTMGRRPRWKAAVDALEETLAVRVLRWTRGETVSPPDPDVVAEELGALGMRVESFPLDRGYPHPHLMFVARPGARGAVSR